MLKKIMLEEETVLRQLQVKGFLSERIAFLPDNLAPKAFGVRRQEVRRFKLYGTK